MIDWDLSAVNEITPFPIELQSIEMESVDARRSGGKHAGSRGTVINRLSSSSQNDLGTTGDVKDTHLMP
jgi:hypothetical protein